MTLNQSRSRVHARHLSGNANEFVVSLSVFFFFAVVPVIDLLGLASGAATVWFLVEQAVTKASVQNRYSSALSVLEAESSSIAESGIGNYVRLKPVGGYKGCGVDLFVTATNCKDQSVKLSKANQRLGELVDPSTYVYEFTASAKFNIGPTIPLRSIPVIDQIPGIGRPAAVSISASRVVEHSEVVAPESEHKSGSGSKLSLKLNESGNSAGDDLTSSAGGWNYPRIYQMIADAGQTVVDEDVLQVAANNPNWTVTNLAVQPGDKIWIDYRADGTWTRTDGTISKAVPFTTADGDPLYRPHGFPAASMVGRMGSGPPFFLGARQWNFTPPQAGNLEMIFNCGHKPLGSVDNASNYGDNQGVMTVRIIIAR